MNVLKKICLFLSVFAISAAAYQGQCYRTYVQVSPEAFANNNNYSAVPYINFSATVNAQITTDSIGPVSFYRTWTPDNNGTRAYNVCAIKNTSTTTSVSFIITPVEDNANMLGDSRLWVGVLNSLGDVTSYTNVDDDHGLNLGFGAMVTLAPSQYCTFIISMYSSSSTRPWFNVSLFPVSWGSTYLDSGYPTVTVDSNGSTTIVNGN